MKRLLFVYGSLLSGMGNFRVLRDSKKVGDFVTTPEYTMIDLGAFPGVLSSGDTSITGEVYEVSDAVYAGVERLEGYPSLYTRTSLETPFGEAEMYIFNHSTDRTRNNLVESGNWREHYK